MSARQSLASGHCFRSVIGAQLRLAAPVLRGNDQGLRSLLGAGTRIHPSGCPTSAGLVQINTTRTALTDLDCQGSRLNGDRTARPLLYVHSYFSFCCCRGCLAGYLWKTIGLEFHFSANVWPLKEANQEDRVPLATGLLSIRQLGSIGFHPSLDPATKLLCIRSIWTTFGRILHLKGFEALNPLRINEPIKSSSGHVYQFHLSTLLHDIIATQLPDTQHRCRVTDGSSIAVVCLSVNGRALGRSRWREQYQDLEVERGRI
jgi:hypothetical protein